MNQSSLVLPSWADISRALPGSDSIQSQDARILLVLLSFFSPQQKIHTENLINGASSRKRWTAEGGVKTVDATSVGLLPELRNLLENRGRLGLALKELESSVVANNMDYTYSLYPTVGDMVRETISSEYLSAWRTQALLVTYWAIPWKYLEPQNPDIQLFLPHLQHIFQGTHNYVNELPKSTKTDLALTLVEASRFPGISWKRDAIHEASSLAQGVDDVDLHSRIAQSNSILARISRHTGQPTNRQGVTGRESNHILGQNVIQLALDDIQVGELDNAKELLESWMPLSELPTPAEQVVLFRKATILGRLLRFEGHFRESRDQLTKASEMIPKYDHLIFAEDLGDLARDLADTLRELDDPVLAEDCVRTAIANRDESGITVGKASLELCLAEALFAQGRIDEARSVSENVQLYPTLLRFDRLRLHLIMGKLHHDTSAVDALSQWRAAKKEIDKFPLTNGHTSRIILLSICDILRRSGDADTLQQVLDEVASLDKTARSGGAENWIAGTRHWVTHLNSLSSSKLI